MKEFWKSFLKIWHDNSMSIVSQFLWNTVYMFALVLTCLYTINVFSTFFVVAGSLAVGERVRDTREI